MLIQEHLRREDQHREEQVICLVFSQLQHFFEPVSEFLSSAVCQCTLTNYLTALCCPGWLITTGLQFISIRSSCLIYKIRGAKHRKVFNLFASKGSFFSSRIHEVTEVIRTANGKAISKTHMHFISTGKGLSG